MESIFFKQCVLKVVIDTAKVVTSRDTLHAAKDFSSREKEKEED